MWSPWITGDRCELCADRLCGGDCQTGAYFAGVYDRRAPRADTHKVRVELVYDCGLRHPLRSALGQSFEVGPDERFRVLLDNAAILTWLGNYAAPTVAAAFSSHTGTTYNILTEPVVCVTSVVRDSTRRQWSVRRSVLADGLTADSRPSDLDPGAENPFETDNRVHVTFTWSSETYD